MDTANALRYKEFARDVLLVDLIRLERTLIELAEMHASTRQVGRTHGMFAEPLTFGFALAFYVDRLGNRIRSINDARNNLRGKLSGAVGAYNSMSLAFPDDPTVLESDVLGHLGLQPSDTRISTQIVQPEYLTDFVYSVVTCHSVIANLADDMRHLHRSEIAEVRERSGEGRVGSSTMPRKINPQSFETVKSMWKVTMPRLTTVLLDQISEHQRDLTNSASMRFMPEILAAVDFSVCLLGDAMQRLEVGVDSMKSNLASASRETVAEPLYILLALNGCPNGFAKARDLVGQSIATGVPVLDLCEVDEDVRPILARLRQEHVAILQDPSLYVGDAVRRGNETCALWRAQVNRLEAALQRERAERSASSLGPRL